MGVWAPKWHVFCGGKIMIRQKNKEVAYFQTNPFSKYTWIQVTLHFLCQWTGGWHTQFSSTDFSYKSHEIDHKIVWKVKHWHQIWVPKGAGFNDMLLISCIFLHISIFLHHWAVVMDPMFRFRHILHSNVTISRLGRPMRPMRTSTSSWAMPGLRQWVDFQETLWDTHGFHMSSPFY